MCNSPPPTHNHTLSLHDALPISGHQRDEAATERDRLWEQADQLALEKGQAATANQAETDRLTEAQDRKSTRLNSSHVAISYAVFCLKKKITRNHNSYDLEQYKQW